MNQDERTALSIARNTPALKIKEHPRLGVYRISFQPRKADKKSTSCKGWQLWNILKFNFQTMTIMEKDSYNWNNVRVSVMSEYIELPM